MLPEAIYANATTTANEMLGRARRTQNAGAHIAGNLVLGSAKCISEALTQARAHLERAMGSYRTVTEEEATRLPYEYGIELGAFSYVHASAAG